MRSPIAMERGSAPTSRRIRSATSSGEASLSMNSTGASTWRALRATVSRSTPWLYCVNIRTGSRGCWPTMRFRMSRPLNWSSRYSPRRTSRITPSGKCWFIASNAAHIISSAEPCSSLPTTVVPQPSSSRRRQTARTIADAASSSTINMLPERGGKRNLLAPTFHLSARYTADNTRTLYVPHGHRDLTAVSNSPRVGPSVHDYKAVPNCASYRRRRPSAWFIWFAGK